MTLALDMKRALSRSSNQKATNEPRHYAYGDTNDFKARHILGLDIAHLRPARKNSVSSTSTNKLRSVTFSDATTAAVTAADLSHSEKETTSTLSRKSSSPHLKRNKKIEPQTDTIKPKASSSSLRSFYDKSRAPLSVSQQTSESSSRDFALRKGAPAIISHSTQETEHSRQLRLIAMSQTGSSQEIDKLEPSITNLPDSSSKSITPSLIETTSEIAESLLTQPSASRISIYRNATSEDAEFSSHLKRLSKPQQPFPITKPVVDPARAKINVRRPKAGTKNWFDSLDTDSSEDENVSQEPRLTEKFALEVTAASPKARIDKIPLRNSSYRPGAPRLEVPGRTVTEQHGTQQRPDHAGRVVHNSSRHDNIRKRKISAFDNVDLMNQSVLHLDSSDDEDEHEVPLDSSATSTRDSFRSSLASGPWDNARIDTGRVRPVSTEEPETIPHKSPNKSLAKLPPLRTAGKRMITYLEDCSTETVTQQDDLLTSFPQTPTDTHSRGTSLRESILSEDDEGSTSTKLMTVTRQEETLIAAMRLKKSAMQRAQAMAHKQALNTLERESTASSPRSVRRGRTGSLNGKANSNSPTTQRHVQSSTALSPPHHSQRTDSVTTFQTESVLQPSVRSSVATYLSEGSEDLQLPYSIPNGLPISSSRLPRPSSIRSEEPPRNRDTFLSEMSTSTYNASISEWSPSVRDSHVVELDPLDRQMLREEIPSQLFMERPFIGWEAQANMQQAH